MLGHLTCFTDEDSFNAAHRVLGTVINEMGLRFSEKGVAIAIKPILVVSGAHAPGQ